MEVVIIKFFLFICPLGVIYGGKRDLAEGLLHNEASLYLKCFYIPGYDKDQKRCEKLNIAFKDLIKVLKKRQLGQYTIRCLSEEEFQKLDHEERIQYYKKIIQYNDECEKYNNAFNSVGLLWRDAYKYDGITNLGGLLPKLRDTSFKKYMEIIKSKKAQNASVVETLNHLFNEKEVLRIYEYIKV